METFARRELSSQPKKGEGMALEPSTLPAYVPLPSKFFPLC